MRCEQIKGRQKYFFVILVHSGTNYLSTKFGLFELILFHTLSEQFSLERDVSDIMCVNATLNDYWDFPCTNINSHSEIWVMGRVWMLKVKSLPKPAGYWMRFINKNCSWNQLASVGKDIHQGVCQNSLKVDDGGTGAAAFEGAETWAKIGPGSIFSLVSEKSNRDGKVSEAIMGFFSCKLSLFVT